jgi:2-keto-4-pentenoate hydratase/2-oxohepta-3-ene-1,7-dioic acid hydratase in catechol pathway
MRFVTYCADGRPAVGVRTPGGIVATGHTDLRDYLEGGQQAADQLKALLESGPATVTPGRLLSPLAHRAQLIFVGGNYQSHIDEVGLTRLQEPVYFPKLWSAVLQPGEPLRPPTADTLLDYEVELAVIIGRTASRIKAEDAMAHVFGYTVVNDISARDVMIREKLQIMLSKSADTFMPVATDIVTADEVELGEQAITCTVNGEIRQKATLDDMIFKVPYLLEFLTRSVTLYPGDLITTGTPGGVAMSRPQQDYLRAGDLMTASVAGVGEVTTTVAAPWENT